MSGQSSTVRALKFVKFFFPIAKFILLVIFTVGLVLRMTGVECLVSNEDTDTMVSKTNVVADANYNKVTLTPAIYDPTVNNGSGQPLGKYFPAVIAKDATVEGSTYKYYGKWVRSSTKLSKNAQYRIDTEGGINVCSSQKIERTLSVYADPASTPAPPLAEPPYAPYITKINGDYWTESRRQPSDAIPARIFDPLHPEIEPNDYIPARQFPDAESIYINKGDTVDIMVLPDPNNLSDPDGNKWAMSFDETNPWDGNNDRGSTAPNYSLVEPEKVLDANNNVVSGNVCSVSNPLKLRKITYDNSPYQKISHCSERWDKDASFGTCPDWLGCWYCRDEETLVEEGHSCWRIRGDGLIGRIGNTLLEPESDDADESDDEFEKNYLNKVLNPFTHNEADETPLTTEQQRYNYYGFYTAASEDEGWLRFRIHDNNPNVPDEATYIGGYNVRVIVTPASCPAENGMAAKNPVDGTAFSDGRGKMEAVFVADDANGNSPDASSGGGSAITLVNGKYPSEKTDEFSTASSDGYLWFKVHDVEHEPKPANPKGNWTYVENTGSYIANVTIAHTRDKLSSIIHSFNDEIRGTISKAVETTFTKMVGAEDYIKAIRALVTLYLVFYFVMFVMGINEANQMDVVIRIIKIAVVLALISPGSWEFFHTHLFQLFMEGSNELVNAMTGNLGSADKPFAFIDKTVGVFFQQDTITKVLALFMVFPIGWFFAVLIFLGIWTYVVAIAKAILSYLVAIVMVGLLLTLAPIFMSFLLFNVTRSMFDSWLKMLVRYTLEPVLLIVGLTILNELVVIALHGVIGHPACWKCAISFDIPGYGDLFCFYFYMPWGYSASATMLGLDFGAQLFITVVIFEIVTQLAEQFVSFMPRITATLTGTSALMGTNLTGNIRGQGSIGASMTDAIDQDLKSIVGRDDQSVQRRRSTPVPAATPNKGTPKK